MRRVVNPVDRGKRRQGGWPSANDGGATLFDFASPCCSILEQLRSAPDARPGWRHASRANWHDLRTVVEGHRPILGSTAAVTLVDRQEAAGA